MTCLFAGVCFASFGWGMAWHFQRAGRPSKTMLLTGVLALICTIIQVTALFRLPPKWPFAAIMLYAAGLALFWSAVRVSHHKLAVCGQTTAPPSSLITKGPYRFIRHPFYTSYNLVWIAGFVATGWPPSLLPIFIMPIIYEWCARQEERLFAAGPLAMDYLAYRRQTGRYLPGL